MTTLQPELILFRDQLRDAIARDLERARRPRARARWMYRTAVPLAGAAGAAVLAMTFTAGPPVSSADAAILHHVEAALTSPPGTILHERALVTARWGTAPYELWALSTPPHHFRVIKWGHEGTGRDARTYDPAATLRSLIRSGRATVDGPTAVGGVPAFKLTVSGAPDRFLDGTVYVDRSTYRPLLIDTTAKGGERIVFQAYEYLPVTPANLRLLNAAGPNNATAGKHVVKPVSR